MSDSYLFDAIQVGGPMGAIVAYFLYQEFYRERRRERDFTREQTARDERELGLIKEFSELEMWVRTEFVHMLKENQAVVSAATRSMDEHTRALTRFTRHMEKHGFNNNDNAKAPDTQY